MTTSPCIDVCRMDPLSGWCQGCLRTIDEIAGWGRLDDRTRLEIWGRLDARRATAAGQATLARGADLVFAPPEDSAVQDGPEGAR